MTLNRAQQVALCAGGLAMLGMLLFPPWRYRLGLPIERAYSGGPHDPFPPLFIKTGLYRLDEACGAGRDRLAYAFIFSPQGMLDEAASSIRPGGRAFNAVIDVSRVVVQSVAVAFGTFFLVLFTGCFWPKRRQGPEPLSPEEANSLLDGSRRRGDGTA